MSGQVCSTGQVFILLTIFCILILLITEKGVLKSLTVTMDLSISASSLVMSVPSDSVQQTSCRLCTPTPRGFRTPTPGGFCTPLHLEGSAHPYTWGVLHTPTPGCFCTSTSAATAAKSLQSCPTLCNPRDGSPSGFPIPGILQVRTLEWVAISFSNASK